MKLLLLNHYAGSPEHGMEFRPFYMAREWIRAGHPVLIVGASYSHARATQPAPGATRVGGVNYRFYETPRYRGNGVGRARNIWSFCRQVWKGADALVREFAPDVVIASSTYPMDVWVARRIARRAGAKLVYEVHDLWPLSPIELAGMSKWHPFAMLCQKAENDALRDADVVVSILPKVHQHMAHHGLDLEKLHIVPNGITVDEWERPPEALEPTLAAHLSTERSAGRTLVGYAGSHGLPNALDVLLDAVKLLQAEPFAFVLVGSGLEKARLAARIADERIVNVRLFDPIPKAQVPAFLGALDIAWIGWQKMPIYRFGIAPNKLMDYMMAGCTVLHAVDAGNDPVAEAGCGLTVEPESPEATADGLRRLADLPAAERRAMGARGRAFVLAHHTYPVLARRFIEAVESRAATE